VAPEQLLLLAMFLLVALANFIARLLRTRRAPRPRVEPEEELPEPPPPKRPRREAAGTPAPTPPPMPVAGLAPAPPPLARPPSRFYPGDPRELRRAIVWLAVLGPCRARETEDGDPTRALGPR
jgi:hypothetical protein